MAVLVAAIVTLGVSSVASAATPSVTAETTPASAARRAVVVVGPVGSETAEYVKDAKQITWALRDAGVKVDLIIPPHATWARVKAAAQGAHFFAYLGHGNGWPSSNVNNGEDSKDGLGLNPTDGDSNNYHVKYVGANFLRGGYHCSLGVPPPPTEAGCKAIKYGVWKNYGKGINLAGNSIVLLNSLCYASGNGEHGMPIPSQAVAVQRVDNYASGFLAAGARTVFSLSWQPGRDIAKWLATKSISMDAMFKLRDAKNGSPYYLPFHGWVGYIPKLYIPSARTQGARLHLDPDLDPAHRNGYLRAVTGDLKFTTDAWWGR
jgi:hypothetical protein